MLSCAASVAQLVELLICNQWVGGSSPSAGSTVANFGFWSSVAIADRTFNSQLKWWGSRVAKGNRL